jgi:nickel-dependent lactate racemase
VEIWLPYGRSEVPIRIPDENLVDILQPRMAEESQIDYDHLVSDEIIASAKDSQRICIVVGDSRNDDAILKATGSLVVGLTHAGVPQTALTILETPRSPPMSGILPDNQVIRHSPVDSSTISCEGFSGDFVPSINKIAAEAPMTIIVGELMPNHFTLLAGLCDIIFPGLASDQSARAELVRSKPMDPHDMYKERLAIASLMRKIYALGFTLDSNQSVVQVSLGPLNETVERLGGIVQNSSMVQASKPAEIVVMSVGGRPLDESLSRSVEAFPAGLSVLKRSGALIVAAECSLGHGNSDFYAWISERKEPRHLEARLRHRFNYDGWKAAFLTRALANHRIYLVSTIPDHHIEHTFGMRPAKTMNAALQSAQRALGADASITVIPNASQVTPSISPKLGELTSQA